ncbi:unnamed protein product [Closterium sp. Naga37s-1]|nr:unnamed protein product [Closterium sp. Naga37s-1]
MVPSETPHSISKCPFPPSPSPSHPAFPRSSPHFPSHLPTSAVDPPCFQHCNRPSPSLLSSLRSHHLLPLAGLPLFHANWTLRHPPPVPLPPPGGPVSADMAANVAADMANAPGGAAVDADGDGFAGVRGVVGEDWVVVVAVPPGAMLLDKMEEMVDEMIQDNWWHGRVVYFRGGMGVQEARALFSRTLLLISPPGEALDLILFMPRSQSPIHLPHLPNPFPPSSPSSPNSQGSLLAHAAPHRATRGGSRLHSLHASCCCRARVTSLFVGRAWGALTGFSWITLVPPSSCSPSLLLLPSLLLPASPPSSRPNSHGSLFAHSPSHLATRGGSRLHSLYASLTTNHQFTPSPHPIPPSSQQPGNSSLALSSSSRHQGRL